MDVSRLIDGITHEHGSFVCAPHAFICVCIANDYKLLRLLNEQLEIVDTEEFEIEISLMNAKLIQAYVGLLAPR
jgi:hypothetical protein